ncbi:hypothetical protein OIDMADRAFT_37551 [Oidiodendron maius Zn]|uniref:amidase n=1 Tax=Oidiodendron maius (strain Zn) TaxID=913774 RepID=A0A0C3DAI8_OIDMZ|nr:hypothetical protein OIDMADRAFT_37551 [Oidiodendron maius Zn]
MGSISLTWQDLAEKKRQSLLDLIPSEWCIPLPIPSAKERRDVTGAYTHQFLSPHEIAITETNAAEIVKNTCNGSWTATEVVTAFCHRAALAHQLLNCLHEIFFDQAIAKAKALDALFAEGGPVGPLHGLPVSLKDQFHVEGVETTMGYVGWIDTFEGEKGTGKERVFESEMVRELRKCGAIPFCKTSVPHTLMAAETKNNIIGCTLNPFNRNMSCGGSSGGEGALIGFRGSPAGFGTDIGGSVRIPSGFNGLFGLRPSHGRLPYGGAANSMDGQNTIRSVAGPIATSAKSLKLLTKSILNQEPWLYDPLVVEMPWREQSKADTLSFGIVMTESGVRPQPPVRRALDTVISVAKKLGHGLVEWNPPSHKKALEIGFSVFLSDGGLDIHKHIGLSGEPLHPRVAELYGNTPSAPITADKVAENYLQQRAYQKEYLDYWNSTAMQTGTGRPVDAVICMLSPMAALQLDSWMFIGCTPWVNVLDYSAIVIPVTKVDKDIDKFDEAYQPVNEDDRKTWESYNPDIQHGTPVGIQIVGRRFNEEKLIEIAELFEEALKDLSE